MFSLFSPKKEPDIWVLGHVRAAKAPFWVDIGVALVVLQSP